MFDNRYNIILVAFFLIVFTSEEVLAQSHQNAASLEDTLKPRFASLAFYCKEKLDAAPGASLLKEKFPELQNSTAESTIDPQLKTRLFSKPVKKALIQRAKIRYECSTERSQAFGSLGSALGLLFDLIQDDILANSLLLISQNADAYTYLTTQQQIVSSRFEAFKKLGKQAESGAPDYKTNLRKETLDVEDHLNQVLSQLDAQWLNMRNNHNVTCDLVGPYHACFN